MRKWRTLIEGPEWQDCREATGLTVEIFDEVFRFAAANISCDPKTNTTPFLTDDHRIMRISVRVWPIVLLSSLLEAGDPGLTL